MKVLIVLAHPRRNSLTGQVTDALADVLTESGHTVEIADLYTEGFDPRLREADEPDWERTDKVYSAEVRTEMARLDRNDAIILVFPIWWWSFPAILKGWVDRVWNKDYAYDGRKLHFSHAMAVGLSASDAEGYASDNYDTAMMTEIVTGLFNYCGIRNGRLEFLHGSTGGGEDAHKILEGASRLGREFLSGVSCTGSGRNRPPVE